MIIEHWVNAPSNKVIEHLTDIKKFCSVHPVIYKIIETESGELLIYERMPFFGISFFFNYPARIEKYKNQVLMSAVVKKLVHIQIDFIIEEREGKTKITETVHVKSFLPIRFLMNKVFKKQHRLLFKNIEMAN